MKRFIKAHRLLSVLLAVVLVVVIGIGVFATSYALNKTIPASITVNTPPPTYSINITSDPASGGSTTGGGSFFTSGSHSITATPNLGYQFLNWTTDSGTITDPNNASTTITITSDVNVVAHFATLVTLYTDLECTQEVTNLNFGSVLIGSNPITIPLYFKSDKTSMGVDFPSGQINPATINVTSDISPSVASLSYIVGTPFGSLINSNHPCLLAITVTPTGSGTSNFNVLVTGTN